MGGWGVATKTDVSFNLAPFPLLLVTFETSECSRAGLSQLFEGFEVQFARKQQYAVIIDASRITQAPDAAWRRELNDWQSAHAAETRRCNVGAALLITSPMVRGVMTAIEWLYPPITPRTYSATMLQAIDWCIGRLRERAIPISPGLRDYRQRWLLGG
jgi:hypothetical protein